MDFITNVDVRIFTTAFVGIFALLGLEIVMTMIGVSTYIESDTDFDAGAGIDAPEPDLVSISSEIDFNFDSDVGSGEAESGDGLSGSGFSILETLGLTRAPLTIWLASFGFGFGTFGYLVQKALIIVMGGAGPVTLIALIAIAPGLFAARTISGVFGHFVPRIETTAISTRSYGRRRGVVTVGVSRMGSPAQVRFYDGHGNLHHTMAEPLDPKDEIPEGAEVSIVRLQDGALRIIRID